MKKENQLTFHKADFSQYWYLLKDDDISSKVSSFLLKYVSVEAFYKKLLVSYKERDGVKLKKSQKNNLSVEANDVKKTLTYFDISYDDALIDRIFGSQDNNYLDCSIKKLRNRLVHNVNDGVLRVILERYDNINTDLDDFLKLFAI